MDKDLSIRLVKKLITEKTEQTFWLTQIHKAEYIQPFNDEDVYINI